MIVLLIKIFMKLIMLYIILGILLVWIVCIGVYYFLNATRLLFSKTKKAPYIPCFDRQLELMKNLGIKKGSTIVDLGCGDGKALRFFVKNYAIKSADWFDINFYAIFRWKRMNKRQWVSNVYLYKKNLFDVDLKKYDYIYLYLRETQLAIMEDRLRENKKKDAIIISNSFKFKKHEPFKTVENERGYKTVLMYK